MLLKMRAQMRGAAKTLIQPGLSELITDPKEASLCYEV